MTAIPFFQSPAPQPAYPQTYQQQPYAPQQYAPQPAPQAYAPQPLSGAGWQSSPQSPVLAAQAAQINQPKARGYAPEPQPKPAAPAAPKTIQLPTPEELGLKTAAPTPVAAAPTPILPAAAQDSVDWNKTHARLRELGAVGFQLDHLPGGVTRVRMMMPTNQPGQSRLVEAIASNETEAIATMFERASH